MKKSLLLSAIATLSFGLYSFNASAQACFTSHTEYSVNASNPVSMVTADLNGDGKNDLVTANVWSNNVSVLINSGTGTFGAANLINAGNSPTSVALADLNGDGKLDLVVVNSGDNNLYVLFGNGNGTFGVPATVPLDANSPQAVTISDLNADGKKDLVVSYNSGSNVSVLLNNGSGVFSAIVDYPSGHNGETYIASADLNNDGKTDLAVANNDGSSTVTVLLGNGNGTFQAASDVTMGGGNATFISLVDVNSDAKNDIVASSDNGNVYIFISNGNGTFQTAVTYSSGSSSYGNTVADFNGDGKVDLAATDYGNGLIYLYTGDGNGNFANVSVFNTASWPSVLVSADFNGDGKQDWATDNQSGSNNVSVLFQSTLPSVHANATATFLCNGGSVKLSGSGSAISGGYTWSGGVTDNVSFVPPTSSTYTVWGTTAGGCTNMDTIRVNVDAAIVLPSGPTYTVSDVTCKPTNCNGTAGLASAVTGGTGAYTYAWSPSGGTTSAATGLCAGTYTLKVTDAKGCNASGGTATIANTTTVTAGPTATDAGCTCNGTAAANGTGTGTLTYVWSPSVGTGASVTGLCPGVYSVTVTDANGCKAPIAAATVNNVPSFTASFATQNAVCSTSHTGSVTATMTPLATYTFSWAPSGGTTATATGLTPGTYSLTATGVGGCSNVFTVVIGTTPMTLSFSNTTAHCSTSCNGTSQVVVNGDPSVISTYLWSNAQATKTATGLCGNNSYSVTVTDNQGCVGKSSTSINTDVVSAFNSPSASVTTQASCTQICNGVAMAPGITANDGTAPYTYAWSPSGGTNATASGLCAGTTYTVTAKDANGCALSSYSVATVAMTTIPSALTTSANDTKDADCFSACDGQALASPSNGVGSYTYLWAPSGGTNNTATGLCGSNAGKNYTVTVTDAMGCKATSSTTIYLQSPIHFWHSSVTDASCPAKCDGSETIMYIHHGEGSYHYLWMPGGQTTLTATGLCGSDAGTTYTVTVTDSLGCSRKDSTHFNIYLQPQMHPHFTWSDHSNASCIAKCDGTVGISGVDNPTFPPFTYSWAPSGGTNMTATGLCGSSAGIQYTVTVTDAKGCVTKDTASQGHGPSGTVWLKTPMSANMNSSTYASCASVCDGTASLYSPNPVNNGNGGPYTYLWSPSGGTNMTATGLCGSPSGIQYAVTITDASTGCSSKDSTEYWAQVWSYSAFSPHFAWHLHNNASCDNVCDGTVGIDYVNYSSPDFSPYTYLWANGQTTAQATGLCGSSTGIQYACTVTDSKGCSVKDSATASTVWLQHHMWPNIYNNAVQPECANACNGYLEIDNVWHGTGPYTYQWFNGSTSSAVSGLCAGTYSTLVTISDAVGCKYAVPYTMNDAGNGVQIHSMSFTNTFCNSTCSGTATANLWYGMAPYKYMWSNGQTTATATGLCQGSYSVTVTDGAGCSDMNSVTIGVSSAVLANLSHNNSTCDQVCNGTAMSSPSSGLFPYKFMWSNGQTTATATGLCGNNNAGVIYKVTVTDANGCTALDSVNVGAVDYMRVGTHYNEWDASCDQVCNGKDSSVVWRAGVAPYHYAWSSGSTNQVATGLCGGMTYSLTVTDAIGCKAMNTITIGTDAPAVVTTTNTNVNLCSSACNGTAHASVSGGSAPFTYNWSSGQTTATATGLCVGAYNVNVTYANGCVVMGGPVTVISTTTINISSTATSVRPSCHGTCDATASAMVTGGTAPYAYAWSPSGGSAASAGNLCAGTYTVSINDANGCKTSSIVNIIQPAALVTNVTVTNSASCVEGNGTATANVAGGNAPYSYAWTPTGQITQSAIGLPDGTYSVTVTDSTGCSASGSGVVTCTSGINEISAENMFTISPNPTLGYFVITDINGNHGIDAITIDNILGQKVYSETEKHVTSKSVDLTSEAAGVYFMRITSSGKVYTQKVVISK